MKTIVLVGSAIALLLLLGLLGWVSMLLTRGKRKFIGACNSFDELTGTEYDLHSQKIYDELYSDEEYTEGFCIDCFGRLQKDFHRYRTL